MSRNSRRPRSIVQIVDGPKRVPVTVQLADELAANEALREAAGVARRYASASDPFAGWVLHFPPRWIVDIVAPKSIQKGRSSRDRDAVSR